MFILINKPAAAQGALVFCQFLMFLGEVEEAGLNDLMFSLPSVVHIQLWKHGKDSGV